MLISMNNDKENYSFLNVENVENFIYGKVASVNMSKSEAHFRFYRLLMKGKFDVYLLLPFKKKMSS